MSHQNHNYVGDKTKFESKGMDEQEFLLYRCPVCRYEEDIAVQFDQYQGYFILRPLNVIDTICPECHEIFMEKA